MLSKILLYWHTVKYLKWTQIRYRLYYYIRNKYRSATGFQYNFRESSPKAASIIFESGISAKPIWSPGNRFSLLNLDHTFKNRINWNFDEYGKLWTYNLNYFEYLTQSNITKEQGVQLIKDYITNIADIKGGLEPFPTSLRIVNWIKFLSEHLIVDDNIDRCLYAQLSILKDHLEYHLLGNHLLENGFALLFGATYFSDRELFVRAKTLLRHELKEQLLSDGGHFELSPMYHKIMLHRLLDSINLMTHNFELEQPDEFVQDLTRSASVMVGWLQQITFENGDIPLFNDSAREIAPSSAQLFAYSKRLDIEATVLPLGASGYKKVRGKKSELVFDIGNVGPSYIPGHAHSDTFNFELKINGTPLIVDTGTSTYEKSQRRNYERSTAAHNTVQIGDWEQSEVWGGFRVARRAVPQVLCESDTSLKATHNGYKRRGYVHQRNFDWSNNHLEITDIVTGEPIKNKAFFHFHPSINIKVDHLKVVTSVAIIDFKGAQKLELCTYEFASAFNKTTRSQRLIAHFESRLNTTFSWE